MQLSCFFMSGLASRNLDFLDYHRWGVCVQRVFVSLPACVDAFLYLAHFLFSRTSLLYGFLFNSAMLWAGGNVKNPFCFAGVKTFFHFFFVWLFLWWTEMTIRICDRCELVHFLTFLAFIFVSMHSEGIFLLLWYFQMSLFCFNDGRQFLVLHLWGWTFAPIFLFCFI